MRLDPDRPCAYTPLQTRPRLSRRDTILYALGVGGGSSQRAPTPHPIPESSEHHVADIDARFTSPACPGETIRTETWRQTDGQAALRSRATERYAAVPNNGHADYR